MERITVLYVPCASDEEAGRIAKVLLEERLVACANIWQSRSIFRWEGEIQDGPETIMLLKTTPEREAAAWTRVRQLHSYSVPCIVTLESRATNAKYARWIYGEVGAERLDGKTEE